MMNTELKVQVSDTTKMLWNTEAGYPTILKTLTAMNMVSLADLPAFANFAKVKKVLAILLLVLYGVSSTGATIQLHYCCGKLKTIKLNAEPVKNCGSKMKMGSKPCCETKQVSVKNQHQGTYYTISLDSKAPAELQHAFVEVKNHKPAEVLFYQQTDYSPPPLSQSLCILNCVFRI